MEEVWKNIEGYEGLYQVSSMGRVKSLKFTKEIIMELTYTHGYFRVGLCRNGKAKHHLVHRLVAEAFIPNPDNLPIINHKDECKTNNVVENLEWCDHLYNNTYGTAIQCRIEKNAKPVYQYSLDGDLIKEWPSAAEVKRSMGFSAGNIGQCCLGKRKTAYGYIWKYAS